MAYDLRPDELRVLGVLIEKQLAVPESYPMTINSIVAACNQKTNRDPVTAYTESEISTAVSSLRRRQLVDQAPPERNSRSIRFQHLADRAFGWNAAQRAIMCELMVRGPQTLGEIRTHAGRMTHLESLDYARELLGELERIDPPLVVELEREPGRRERRFAQLLGGAVVIQPAPVGQAFSVGMGNSSSESVPSLRMGDPLESRVAELEGKVRELTARLDELARGLGA